MNVLFVCLGNICRSPAAEGVFQKMVNEAGLGDAIKVDSAGTAAYHTGEEADGRMQLHAQQRGYELKSLARRFELEDYDNFDYILTMDNSNFDDVTHLARNDQDLGKVHKMTSFCKVHEIEEVPDPYYKADEGFRIVMDILEDSCGELLAHIKQKL